MYRNVTSKIKIKNFLQEFLHGIKFSTEEWQHNLSRNLKHIFFRNLSVMMMMMVMIYNSVIFELYFLALFGSIDFFFVHHNFHSFNVYSTSLFVLFLLFKKKIDDDDDRFVIYGHALILFNVFILFVYLSSNKNKKKITIIIVIIIII